MSITKLKDRKAVIYICAFLLPFLMMQVFWAICGVYPYGDRSILTGDMDVEFVNFYAYFLNTFRTNNDWSYMFAKTLGGDFPGLAAFQLHDPLLFLLFLFPQEKIATGIEFLFTVQVSFAGLSASVLLNNRYKRSWASLLFSTGYAFSAFFFGYLVLTIYFGALALLPLVIYYFLEHLDGKKSFIPFILTTCLYIYVNYHMGFMLVLFLVILYFSRLIADTSLIKKIPSLVLSGITVLLIDAFFLVRIGYSLLGEKTTAGADYGFYRRFPLDQLFAGMFCGCARNDLRPLIYCSVIAFFFAVCYFLSGKFTLKEKLANLAVIAAVSVSMWINTFDAVWHGFNNPEGFWWRYAYYVSITVIAIGYKAFVALILDEEEDGNRKTVILSALALCLYMAWLMVRRNDYLDMARLVMNAGIIVLIVFAVMLLKKGGTVRVAGFALLFAVTVGELLYSSKTSYLCLNTDGDGLPLMAGFFEDYREIGNVISYIKSEDDGFYRIEKDFDRAINDPSMFDYIGLSHNSSCEKDEILDWLVNFGFCKTVYFTYYNGGSTAFTDDFFGIRYYVSRFDTVDKPYEHLPYEGKYHAYSNKDALPLAYAAPEGLDGFDMEKGNTFEKQNGIASFWSDRPVFIKADSAMTLDGARQEGNARFVRTDDEGFIVYNIKVTEKMPLYFYFYAPHRQNAEVFVNGESRDVYFTVNHWNTLCAGTYDPGEEIEIRLQIKDDEIELGESCFYYEDPEALSEWGQKARTLNEGIGEVRKITSSHLVFETDNKEDRKIMMSIPYEDSWKITCDGAGIEKGEALEILMCFDVPAGHHTIEMKYVPEGTFIGALLSAFGILLFAGRIIFVLWSDGTIPRRRSAS